MGHTQNALFVTAYYTLYALCFIFIFYFYIKLFVGKRQYKNKPKLYFHRFASTLNAGIYSIFTVALITLMVPVYVGRYTLTNGQHVVTFQGMSHTGLPSYYNIVDQDIRRSRVLGHTILREGIGLNGKSPLSVPRCHIPASKTFIPMVRQPDCLGGIYPDDIYADIPLGDLMYYQYGGEKAGPQGLLEDRRETLSFTFDTVPAEDEFPTILHQLYFKSYLTYISIRMVIDPFTFDISHTVRDPVLILDKRNRILAHQLLTSNADDTYVFYGLSHLPGLLEELRVYDPNWQIVNVDFIRAL